MQSLGIAVSMFLNGATVIRFQVIQTLSFGVLAFSLTLILAPHLGAAGIVRASDIPYCALVVRLCIWFIRQWLARADWARSAPQA